MSEKAKKSRKTVHNNPAIVLMDDQIFHLANKEDAEKYVKKHLPAGETATVFLLYKEYEVEVVVTTKLKAKK